jgi:hypothetical protein
MADRRLVKQVGGRGSLVRGAMRTEACCILNGGGGAWAFARLADQLSRAMWLDVSEVPAAD